VRTFIAIALSDEIRTRLAAAQERLRAANCPVKWVKPDLMHVTLRFLGEIQEPAIPDIERTLASAAHGVRPFQVTVAGLGAFPERGAPRVLWAGLSDNGSLALLNRRIEDSLSQLGFAPQDRPFSPHLTLGRVKDPRRAHALRRLLDKHASATFGSCTIEELLLILSVVSPAGPTYTPLRRQRL